MCSNIANMKQQLIDLGCSFDWHRVSKLHTLLTLIDLQTVVLLHTFCTACTFCAACTVHSVLLVCTHSATHVCNTVCWCLASSAVLIPLYICQS